ncbi:hypothetical protein R70723_03295 [Paenibacillus sp. FSL R7-0273]|uniref:DUF4007 family protein n=1 Tax=Paenibacillus sp. FSL R7-0273 TaxID=1536772 RepID=UPI0004F78B07|nr:DUF4007 family protein [Paenibacillus sp. FSL R7-0273]AIQ45036.1 hypothetical protein R70723_03295 [Paenibacillus sp. FSL R7-0273]OMF88650.1 hypothetical protein BK144_21040 [Paenibacillus sp. FSL R7-0273]
MAYARHQSFYIRDKWFSKGLKAVKQNNRFFFNDYAFETVGLGKNMLESLKYWLFAFDVLEETIVEGQRIHSLTELGEILFQHDRLLQKNESLAILHYHLVRNTNDYSTVFDWYFNRYRETSVSKPDLLSSFITWVSQNEVKEISENSLKRDIDCLIQFYTKTPDENDPEDGMFSPFSKLTLMKSERSGEGFDTIKKITPELNVIEIVPLYYILLNSDAIPEDRLISVDEIVKGDNLWGKIFNLSRNKVVEALNILTNHEKYPIEYVRTNNLDYIRLPMITSVEYIKSELLKG